MIALEQTGQCAICCAHSKQHTRCPQGLNTTFTCRCPHILHIVFPFNTSFSLANDPTSLNIDKSLKTKCLQLYTFVYVKIYSCNFTDFNIFVLRSVETNSHMHY